MEWIYLSPHFDDAALSCGGLIWEQAQAGQAVHIWTICGGQPGEDLSGFAQEKHRSWERGPDAVAVRRAEDADSCAILGAGTRYFSIPDCIYRRHPQDGNFLYDSEELLWGGLHKAEEGLLAELSTTLEREIPADARLISPIALGNHVDHQFTRMAVERLERDLWYYADYPYVLNCEEELAEMRRHGWMSVQLSVSEQGMDAWQRAVAAHASQLSTFWADIPQMETALREYRGRMGGTFLWRSPSGG
jgi:LmbE family N-acetylglucosaminyl deacetylase